MKNLVLPDIDLSQPPTLNDHKYSYWNLIDDTNHDYVCFENALSPTEVNEVIKIGRSFFVNQSLTADGTGHSDIRRSYNSWIPPCKVSNSLYIKLQKLVKDANEYFCYELHSLENRQLLVHRLLMLQRDQLPNRVHCLIFSELGLDSFVA